MKRKKGKLNKIMVAIAEAVVKFHVNSASTHLFYQKKLPKGAERFRKKED